MIILENINKIYKTGDIEVHALKNINLHIKMKEFTAIIGSSGSGKSTMMNILGCLDTATSGRYLLNGLDISQVKEDKIAEVRNKQIGFVFQSFNLLPKLTAVQNVELPMMYAGVHAKERHERAKKALERVGLGDRIHHKPNELSGGQRQRVAIARALVNNPAIILADEPTGNLDSKSEKEIIEIFKELNREGVTIVMVTHEPEIAANCKRAITFKDGEVISDKINY
ncbi:MAG: putative transport system ATP-binding protein [Fusobacteriaceae bacterium]|jgi:putative ABC transport system ATP-binding protein|nr:putative transport system ATP-binding protein [Fusobacteriaceae bacterium]